MQTKEQIKYAEEKSLKEKITNAIGETLWDFSSSWKKNKIVSIYFRIENTVNLKTLQKLSDVLGTEKINFNFGREGECGYSEYTPGTDNDYGFIEAYFEDEEWKKT